MKVPSGPNEFQRKLLERANKVAGEIGGKQITQLEKAFMTIEAHMGEKPDLAKIYVQAVNEAASQERDFKIATLTEAFEYKRVMSEAIERAKKAGRTPPECYPHPDDIIIGADLSIKFIGPVTASEARELEDLLKFRDNFFETVRSVIAEVGITIATDEGLPLWKQMRRQYYRFSPNIPKHLRVPFPKYESKLD